MFRAHVVAGQKHRTGGRLQCFEIGWRQHHPPVRRHGRMLPGLRRQRHGRGALGDFRILRFHRCRQVLGGCTLQVALGAQHLGGEHAVHHLVAGGGHVGPFLGRTVAGSGRGPFRCVPLGRLPGPGRTGRDQAGNQHSGGPMHTQAGIHETIRVFHGCTGYAVALCHC